MRQRLHPAPPARQMISKRLFISTKFSMLCTRWMITDRAIPRVESPCAWARTSGLRLPERLTTAVESSDELPVEAQQAERAMAQAIESEIRLWHALGIAPQLLPGVPVLHRVRKTSLRSKDLC